MTKSEYIKLLAPAVIRGGRTAMQAFESLNALTVPELESMRRKEEIEQTVTAIRATAVQGLDTAELDQKLRAAQEERLWTRLFFYHPDVVDDAANRELIHAYALSLSDDGVVTFDHLHEAATNHSGLSRKKLATPKTLEDDQERL